MTAEEIEAKLTEIIERLAAIQQRMDAMTLTYNETIERYSAELPGVTITTSSGTLNTRELLGEYWLESGE